MKTKKFNRYCPGLYVDISESFVISREEKNLYTIRLFKGLGLTLSGKLFPDYGHQWLAEYRTLAEAKNAVVEMLRAR